jgi:hypothetical protein
VLRLGIRSCSISGSRLVIVCAPPRGLRAGRLALPRLCLFPALMPSASREAVALQGRAVRAGACDEPLSAIMRVASSPKIRHSALATEPSAKGQDPGDTSDYG